VTLEQAPAIFIARIMAGGNPTTTRIGFVVRSLTSTPFAGAREQVEQLLEDMNTIDGKPWRTERAVIAGIETRWVYYLEGWRVRLLELEEWRRVKASLLEDLDALAAAGEDPVAVSRERDLVAALDACTAAEYTGEKRLPEGVGDGPAWRWLTRWLDVEIDPGVDGLLVKRRSSAWWATWA